MEAEAAEVTGGGRGAGGGRRTLDDYTLPLRFAAEFKVTLSLPSRYPLATLSLPSRYPLASTSRHFCQHLNKHLSELSWPIS